MVAVAASARKRGWSAERSRSRPENVRSLDWESAVPIGIYPN
jgi:hypothetical protein